MGPTPRGHTRSLTSILLEAGVVTPDQVDAGLVRQRSTGLRIGETLVEMGGSHSFDQALWNLYRKGEISPEEALRQADSANNLRIRIKVEGSGGQTTGELPKFSLQQKEEDFLDR